MAPVANKWRGCLFASQGPASCADLQAASALGGKCWGLRAVVQAVAAFDNGSLFSVQLCRLWQSGSAYIRISYIKLTSPFPKGQVRRQGRSGCCSAFCHKLHNCTRVGFSLSNAATACRFVPRSAFCCRMLPQPVKLYRGRNAKPAARGPYPVSGPAFRVLPRPPPLERAQTPRERRCRGGAARFMQRSPGNIQFLAPPGRPRKNG